MVKSMITPKEFRVVVRPCTDTTGYWATCEMPDGGCTTQGETMQEIQKNIMESVSYYLEDYPEIANYYLRLEVQDASNTDHQG